MKRNLYCFTTITLLIAATACFAMELAVPTTSNKPTILFDIPITKYENCALFIDDNHIIINGSKTCRKIKLGNSIPLFTIPNLPTNNTLTIHHDKTCFATADKTGMTIYDMQTGTQKVACQMIQSDIHDSILFNSSHNTILFWRKIGAVNSHHYKELMEYNYNTQITSSTLLLNPNHFSLIDTHPTQQYLITEESRVVDNIIKFHHYNEKTKNYDEVHKIKHYQGLTRMIYSPNGLYVATANTNCIELIIPEHNYKMVTLSCLATDTNDRFETVEFHPNSTILAALLLIAKNEKSQKKEDYCAVLQYFDICAGNSLILVAETSLADFSPFCKKNTENALSFSPDGTTIMIRLSDRCIVIPVRCEAIYKTDAHKKMLLINEILKPYNLPPRDIILNLLEAFKR